MQPVLQSVFKALSQLGDPAIIRLLVKTGALTLLAFAVGGAMLGYGIYQALTAWDLGSNSAELAGIVAVLLTGLGIWLWLRVAALAVLQFFADEVVEAVEQRHYPDAAKTAKKLPFARDMANALRGMARTIGVNLLALPLVIALSVTGIGAAAVLIGVNGWLLGRELTDMAWLRHCGDAPEANPVGRTARFTLGAMMAALMAVPFAGLLAPIVGAAAGTHLVHRALYQKMEKA